MQYLLEVEFCLRYSSLLTRKSTLQAFLDRIDRSFFDGCYLLWDGASPTLSCGSAVQFTRCSFSWITSTICCMFLGFVPHSSISLIQERWVPHLSTRIKGYDRKARQKKHTDPGSTGFRLSTLGVHVQWNCRNLRYRCNLNMYFTRLLSGNTQYIQFLWIVVIKILPKFGYIVYINGFSLVLMLIICLLCSIPGTGYSSFILFVSKMKKFHKTTIWLHEGNWKAW